MIFKSSILLVVIAFIGSSFGNEWPSDIDRCKNEDHNCITKVASEVIQKYAGGRADIGLPAFEPIFVPRIVVSEGGKSGLNLDLTFIDLQVEGLSKVKPERLVGFDRDPSTSKFELHGHLPSLHLKGNYEAGGRILILPIQGKGDCDILFENVKCAFKIKPKIITKDGKVYMDVDKLKVFFDPGSMKLKLENLFNGDKALGDNMNTFLNENWRDVWAEVGDSVNVAFAKVIKDKIAGIFRTFPYEEVFSQ